MKRLESIQIMRGIAATMVMIHHFTYANPGFAASFPAFTALFQHFSLGVWMFFVISGFVIPYAMYSIDYQISTDAWRFFLRRLVRLEPTYIVSVLVAFALTFAAARTPDYGGPPEPSLRDFLLQFLYLSQWFHIPWLIDPAWTLAIEFQFYLFMLLAAPLLLSRSLPITIAFFAAVLVMSLLVTDERALFALFALLCDRVRRFPVPCQTHRIFAVADALPRVFDLYLIGERHRGGGRRGNLRGFDFHASLPSRSDSLVSRNDLIFSLFGSHPGRGANRQSCDADVVTMDTARRACAGHYCLAFGSDRVMVFHRTPLPSASQDYQTKTVACCSSFDSQAR